MLSTESAQFAFGVNLAMSIGAFYVTRKFIPKMSQLLIAAGLKGKDLSKRESVVIPESAGVISGTVFIVTLIIFMPIPFYNELVTLRMQNLTLHDANVTLVGHAVKNLPHGKLVEYLAALLSVCCMLLLGFADDVLNLRWRDKLVLPTIASLPLIIVYILNWGSTTVIIPRPFRMFLGYELNVGFIYYIYMLMLAVFCTNAINILAGVNGIEAGQSFVIAVSIIVFNILELGGKYAENHLFSLYMLMPYAFSTLALLTFNWYPSRVFVGDTFCYYSGMTFATVGILGYFNKTLLLFFAPQILNFLYSVPQLFGAIPCPRHRLPKFDAQTDRVGMSFTEFEPDKLPLRGRLCYFVLRTFRLIHLQELKQDASEKSSKVRCNNLTILNFALKLTGPLHERSLTTVLLAFQVACSCLAFFIRYPLANFFYDN